MRGDYLKVGLLYVAVTLLACGYCFCDGGESQIGAHNQTGGKFSSFLERLKHDSVCIAKNEIH